MPKIQVSDEQAKALKEMEMNIAMIEKLNAILGDPEAELSITANPLDKKRSITLHLSKEDCPPVIETLKRYQLVLRSRISKAAKKNKIELSDEEREIVFGKGTE